MATLPLADCSRLLGIHPKTLHHWLKQAKMPLAAHPTDARIKCVTEEHIRAVSQAAWAPAPASCHISAGFARTASSALIGT